ncbi:MAG: flagellar assembly protein FliW [Gemmatimonadales bacterium]|nr:MAG: flagellar assembly protein FliW [Gemmatimonadales bacterium]
MTALAHTLPDPSPVTAPLQGTPIFFPNGLHGFPEHRDFRLQSLGMGRYCLRGGDGQGPDFLAIDPASFLPAFRMVLPPWVLRHLGTSEVSALTILAIVTLPREQQGQPTANLQGLLVLNEGRGLGRQTVHPDSPWGVRTPIPIG